MYISCIYPNSNQFYHAARVVKHVDSVQLKNVARSSIISPVHQIRTRVDNAKEQECAAS